MTGEASDSDRPGRLIAHVGMHKTGTAWFQKHFYPRVRNYRWIPRHEVRDAFFSAHALKFQPEIVRDRLRLDTAEDVVMCEEAFSGSPHNGGHQGALQKDRLSRLHAVRPDATVVVFIRRQPDVIMSVYRQYVREGGTFGLRRYLRGRQQRWLVPRFDYDHYDYLGLYDYCASLFGPDRVQFFPYEEFAEDNRGFVVRYATAFGMNVDVDSLSFRCENAGYTWPAVVTARALNLFSSADTDVKYYVSHVPGARRASNAAAAWLTRHAGGPPAPMPDDLSREITERFRSSNRELASRISLDLARFGYPL